MGVKQLSWRDWPIKEGCLMGPIGLGLSTVLMNFAFQYSNAVNIAIISMMAPLVSIVMGMIRGEERMTFRSGVALCLAIVGGILVSVSNLDAEMGFRGGELLMVFSVILWTWFSRVSVTRLRLIPPFPRMALALTAAGVALLPVVFLIQWSGITTLNPSWSISASWLPMCLILGVALSTGFWMMSVD
jgi:drug/metabolite transporter (DMT)-like permease